MPTLVNFFRNPTRYKTEGLFTPSKSGSKTEKDKKNKWQASKKMFPFAFVRCGWALIVTQITHANGQLASISTIVLFILNFLTAKKQKTKVSRVSFYLYIKYFKHVFFVYVHFSISREYLIQLRVSLSHSTQIHELATKKQKNINNAFQ